MINVLGLCRTLRDKYPVPASPAKIKSTIIEEIGGEPPSDIRMDLVKVLTAQWKREGWSWDNLGAVKLEKEEEALFHENGVSLISSTSPQDSKKLKVLAVGLGEIHPRVIWF